MMINRKPLARKDSYDAAGKTVAVKEAILDSDPNDDDSIVPASQYVKLCLNILQLKC
jgi:hypothetical protein